jgi:hypothetical protein
VNSGRFNDWLEGNGTVHSCPEKRGKKIEKETKKRKRNRGTKRVKGV